MYFWGLLLFVTNIDKKILHIQEKTQSGLEPTSFTELWLSLSPLSYRSSYRTHESPYRGIDESLA